jgi:hypothetical protein
MTHDTGQPDGYQVQRQQHQKQRQQQQQQQELQHRHIAPGRGLPEKQHQPKHNPISETARFDSHSCDQ